MQRPVRAPALAFVFVAPMLALSALAVAPAGAQPMLSPHVGGLTFLGPATVHPTAVFYNPAALSPLPDTQLFVASQIRLDRGDITRDPIDPASGQPDPAGSLRPGATPISFTALEGFAALTSGFGRATFALAVSTPGAEQGSFAATGEGPGGAVRYHRVSQSVRDTYFSLGVGIKVTNRLHAGLALSYALTSFDLGFMRDTALERGSAGLAGDCAGRPCGVENPAAGELIELDTAEQLLTFNGGVLASPREGIWIGLSYLPPLGAGGLTTEGSARVTGPSGAIAVGRAAIQSDRPQRILLGARFELNECTWLGVNLTWFGWQRARELDLRLFGVELRAAGVPERIVRHRGFQDAYAGEVVLDHRWSDHLRYGASIGVATSAVPQQAVNAGALDAPRGEATGSLELAAGRAVITAGYGLILRLPRQVSPGVDDPQATVRCVDSEFDLDLCEDVRLGRGRPSAAGEYSWLTHEISLGIGFRF